MKKLSDKFDLVYKTTTSPFYPGYFVGCNFSTDFHKIARINFKPLEEIVLINNGEVNFFFHKGLKKGAQLLFQKIFSGPKYLEKIKRNEKIISAKLLEEIKTPIRELYNGKKLNEKGEKKMKLIFKLIMNYASYVDAPGFLFQVYLVEDFRKEMFKVIKGDANRKSEIFNLIISSHKLSNYELFLIELFNKKNGQADNRRIARKYYWLIHDYLGPIIDEKYVAQKSKEIKKDQDNFKKNLEDAEKRKEEISRAINNLPEEKRKKAVILGELMYLYNDQKKEVVNQTNIYLRRIFEYKFRNLSISQIRKYFQLTPAEIINLLKGKDIYDLEERNRHWGYKVVNWKIEKAPVKYFSLLGNYQNVSSITGSPASPGKTKGRVSIVLNISHIHLFKPGNILVAPFTNVNYLPIMNKAKAIITDTGGLTSHAAIISRELKIPCIVGTKIATKTLKDGDLVEVDANKGIVKILR